MSQSIARRVMTNLLLGGAAWCTAQLSCADVTNKVVYAYYIATARPNEPIRLALNRASPNRVGDRIFHAYTKWNVNWHYWTHYNLDGSCRITGVQVDLTSSINLPTLVNGTDQQDAQFWTYLLALRTHEMGHVAIGESAARDIDMAILALPEMSSCSALGEAANNAGYQILSDYKSKEIQYDVTTQHGRTQGAVLAP